jgi:histidinol phosphatase-like enzyme (inositol monophosphatase family)
MPEPDDLVADVAAFIPTVLEVTGALALKHFRAELFAEDKGSIHGYDPVTEADRGIEDILRAAVAERYPEHGFKGEERGTSGPDGRYRWVVDPIDGTKAFVSGVPMWGTLVALVDGEVPIAGWLHQPYLQETFAAVGGVATLTSPRHDGPVPLRTRATTRLDEAILYTTHDTMFREGEAAAAYQRVREAVRLQRWGGDCYAYALLALGHIDLVVENGLNDYDILALVPIVEAAGGVVTTLDGDPPLHGGFVVASATPDLHAAAIAALRG